MKFFFKKRVVLLSFVLLILIQPMVILTQIDKKTSWFTQVDDWFQQKYDDINNTFLGEIILRQVREMTPPLIVAVASSFVMMEVIKRMQKDQAKNLTSHTIKPIIVKDTTLADYAGTVPPAILTLVDQIKNRENYKQVNAPITKGVLLTGLPGTGKSFLARAMAGTIPCVFIATSATEFTQPFVGASEIMIRDLFNTARRAAANDPSKLAIIFIDEIDAIGGRQIASSRGVPIGTLQTFLTEMDGFNKTVSVELPWYKKIFSKAPEVSVDIVVLAATNTPQNLDAALKRKGRFDHIIEIKKPDEAGRRAIIALYLKKYSHDESVDEDILVKSTDGMTPADINALFGEAARDAGSKEQTILNMDNFEQALSDTKKVMMNNQEKTLSDFLAQYPLDESITESDIIKFFSDPKMFERIVTIFEEAYKRSQAEDRKINKSDLENFGDM